MPRSIQFAALAALTGESLGTHDVACPLCGPRRKSTRNRARTVLRIWRDAPDFITYSCVRCGASGFARATGNGRLICSPRSERHALNKSSCHPTEAQRRRKAQWFWNSRQPIRGTPAENYLRHARGYGGPLPSTLAFLPACGQHPPAMIAAFGLVNEIEPGAISITASGVVGIHLTRIASGGLGKAGTEADKIMVGAPLGSPIILAPPNDLGGLAITEGIEDALSVHEATGLGAWAAGAASFLPALAAAVPDWVECITILVDDDDAGRRNAYALADQLEHRGFQVRLAAPAEAVGDAR